MIKINAIVPKQLSLADEIVAREITSAMRDATILVESEAKKNVGYVTGTLARSITSTVAPLGGSVKGIVSASASYARFVEEGTGLYGPKNQLIKPKNAKALRWKGAGGDYIFAKSTKGQRPKHFMRNAFQQTKMRVEERFNTALANAVRELNK